MRNLGGNQFNPDCPAVYYFGRLCVIQYINTCGIINLLTPTTLEDRQLSQLVHMDDLGFAAKSSYPSFTPP